MTVRDVSPVLFFGDPDLLQSLGVQSSNGEEDSAKTISPITFLAPFQPVEITPPINEKVEDDGETDGGPKDVMHPAMQNVSEPETNPSQSGDLVRNVIQTADSGNQSEFNPEF